MVDVNGTASPSKNTTRVFSEREHIMNKRIRTGLVSTALVAGSFIGAGVVNAQVDDTDTSTTDTTTVETESETDTDSTGTETETDGTEAGHRHRRGGGEQRSERAQSTADLLGIDVETLQAGYADGLTLADIAEANGVDVQTVIDAKVESKTEHIDAAVEAGRLTDAEAAEKLADLEERVTTGVNEGRPERGDRGGRGDCSEADVADTGAEVLDDVTADE